MSRWFEELGFAEVADGLWLGAYPTDGRDVDAIAELGVTRVLNLCEDVEYRRGRRARVEEALDDAGVVEERVCLVDYGGLALEDLDRAARRVVAWLEAGERVYLHCRAGWQRSATVAGAVVALRDGIGVHEALRRIKARKPSASPLGHQRRDLEAWAQEAGVS
ncbi:MAG: ptpmt1 [Solirubrobacterales bacterium]|nr:ptpmt1 [Solirubrobacterales bacterium]